MRQKLNKHEKRTKLKRKRIFIILLMLLILVLISIRFLIPAKQNYASEIPKNENEENIIPEELEEPEEEPEQFEIVDTSDLPDTYKGFHVLGKIVIDKISVTQKIFVETSNSALKAGVVKFWGPDINEPGNLCLSGHNYQKVFGKLKSLEIGDEFYIVSKDGRKITYTVTEKLSMVNPYDMSHIEQNEDGKRKVTLITCEPRRSYEVYS